MQTHKSLSLSQKHFVKWMTSCLSLLLGTCRPKQVTAACQEDRWRPCVWDLLETPLQPPVLPPVNTPDELKLLKRAKVDKPLPPEPASNHIDTNIGWCQIFSSIKKICVFHTPGWEDNWTWMLHVKCSSLCLRLESLPESMTASTGWMYDKCLYNNKKHSFIKSSSMPFSQKRFSCSCESERKTVDLGLNWLHNYTIKSTHARACTLSHTRKRIHDSH